MRRVALDELPEPGGVEGIAMDVGRRRPCAVITWRVMAREATGSIGPRRPGRDVSGPLTGPGQIRPGHAREPLAVPYVGANPVQRIEDRFEQFIALVKGCLEGDVVLAAGN